MNADAVAQMSCNPAIGGVAKGQIVREIDALGGEMGKCIDASGIQFRMLNRTKGPAMHSPRAQADKKLYQFTMKHWVEEQPNLTLRQELVEGLLLEDTADAGERRPQPAGHRRAWRRGDTLLPRQRRHPDHRHVPQGDHAHGRGEDASAAGPATQSAEALSDSLAACGFELARFKTGTPCRLNGRTIDFSKCELQPGDDPTRGRSASPPTASRMPQIDLPHHLHQRRRSTTSSAPTCTAPRCTRGQIQRPRAALLPVDRGQGGALRRQGPPPDLPRTRRAEHPRVLLQRHQHQPAEGRAAGDAQAHPRAWRTRR